MKNTLVDVPISKLNRRKKFRNYTKKGEVNDSKRTTHQSTQSALPNMQQSNDKAWLGWSHGLEPWQTL
jgi:hypothetical protein